MLLKTSELRAFKQAAAVIKHNGLLPILSYLKLEGSRLTKSNLNAFLTQEITTDNRDVLLLEEKILFNFVDNTTADEITIKKTAKKITYSDSNSSIAHDVMEDDFPVIRDIPTTGFTLSQSTIKAITIAGAYTEDDTTPQLRCFVFVGEKHVCGGNGHILFFGEQLDDIPRMILDKATIAGLSVFETCKFSEDDKYTFFTSGNKSYGFIKPEFLWNNLTPLIKNGKSDFSCQRKEFIRFNNICTQAKIIGVPIATLSIKDGVLQLRMNDTDYNVPVTLDLPVIGSDCEPFNFNATLMNKILKSFPEDEIFFLKGKNNYYISQNNYINLIQEIQ